MRWLNDDLASYSQWLTKDEMQLGDAEQMNFMRLKLAFRSWTLVGYYVFCRLH